VSIFFSGPMMLRPLAWHVQLGRLRCHNLSAPEPSRRTFSVFGPPGHVNVPDAAHTIDSAGQVAPNTFNATSEELHLHKQIAALDVAIEETKQRLLTVEARLETTDLNDETAPALREENYALLENLSDFIVQSFRIQECVSRFTHARYAATIDDLLQVVQQSKRLHLMEKKASLMEKSEKPEASHQAEIERLVAEKVAELVSESDSKPSGGKPHMQSYEQFMAGVPVEQIAAARSLKPGTILGHLASAIAEGRPLDLSLVGLSPEKIALITLKIEEVGDAKLSPLKRALPDDVSFADIKLVLAQRTAAAQDQSKRHRRP